MAVAKLIGFSAQRKTAIGRLSSLEATIFAAAIGKSAA